jgi:hypothetical protein
MKTLQHVRTRRQLFRATAVGAASIPFLALAKKAASAQNGQGGNQGGNGQGLRCLSKVLMVPTARFSQISSNTSDFMGASINPR